jgi:hypothetical protein
LEPAVSIEPIGSIDAGSTATIALQQLYRVDPAERRLYARDQYDVNVLTAGDREFLSAVFGPKIVTIEDLAQAQGLAEADDRAQVERIQANQFIADLIADRQSGALPIGTELTSTYVQAKFDEYVDLNGTVTNPLTEQNLIDARSYFNDRVQGAAIDLKA